MSDAEQTTEKPTYFAVITAEVRYDKDLPPNVKLLFAEITTLTQKDGYCFASNEYFAKLYDVTIDTVSRWITILVNKGYLDREVERDPLTQQVLSRKLRLVAATPSRQKRRDPSPQKKGDPPGKKDGDNKTSINNNLSSKDVYTAEEPARAVEVDLKDHPAIVALRSVVERYPSKSAWPVLIELVGDEPNIERMQACFAEWSLAGYRPNNFNWVRDWYAAQEAEAKAQTDLPKTPDPDPEPAVHSRMDYMVKMAIQRDHPNKEWYVDRQRYDASKADWIETYLAKGEREADLLAEIAAYESSNDFKRRFNETA